MILLFCFRRRNSERDKRRFDVGKLLNWRYFVFRLENNVLQEHRQAVRVTAVFIITTEKFRRSIFVFLCDEIVWYQRASSRIQQIFYVKYLVFHVLMQFISYRGCLHFLCWCEHHPREHSIRPPTLLMITLTNTPKDKHFSMCTPLKKKSWCLGDVARYDSQNIVATLLGHCFEWLQHCSSIATLCCAKNRSCKSSRVTSPLSPCKRNKKLKMMLQGTIGNDYF